MNYTELDPKERLALAALVRLMVRMDGEFTPAEVRAVSDLAREIGATSFWNMLNEAGSMEMAEVAALVDEVERTEVREWMYGVLLGLAAVDGIDEAESELLAWLMDAWSLTA